MSGPADQLQERIASRASADPIGYALFLGLSDWRRAGLQRPAAASVLADLARTYLSDAHLGASSLVIGGLDDRLAWLTAPIAPGVALVEVSDAGYRVTDEAFDQVKDSAGPIPPETWELVLLATNAVELLNVGHAAYILREFRVAQTSLTKAKGSDDPNAAPTGAAALGVLLKEQGDIAGARTAYQEAVDSGHPELAPAAAFSLGLMLAGQDDRTGAEKAYRAAVDSGHPEEAPKAAINLSMLLDERGDTSGAVAVLRRVIESGNEEYFPVAAVNLGVVLEATDVEGAQQAYERAIASGQADAAPRAAYLLGQLLAGRGDLDGAITAYQRAIGFEESEFAPQAAFELGELLAQHDDADGAEVAYLRAVELAESPLAEIARFQLGWLYGTKGHVTAAKAAYLPVTESGLPELAVRAATNLGQLLAEHGDPDGAIVAYRQVVESGHPDFAAKAAYNQGVLLVGRGDAESARAAYRRAFNLGDEETSQIAAAALATLPQGPPDPRYVNCPSCGTTMQLHQTIDLVSYPGDVDLVESIATGEFKEIKHFCGARVATLLPKWVTDCDRRVVIVMGDNPVPENMAGWAVQRVTTYAAMSRPVCEWLQRDAEDLMRMVADGTFFALDGERQIEEASPLRLLALPLEIVGRRRARMPADGISELEDIFGDLIAAQVVRLVYEAAGRSDLAGLLDVVQRRIPRRCLGEVVLAKLLSRCDDDAFHVPSHLDHPEEPLFDGPRVAEAFRAELAAAVAHHRAGRVNPREGQFAALIVALWTLSHYPGATIDDRFFLDRRTLQATIGPDVLFNAAVAGFGDRPADWTGVVEFADCYQPLMSRAGYADWFDEAVYEGNVKFLRRFAQPVSARELIDSIRPPTPDDLERPDGPGPAVDSSFVLGAIAAGVVEVMPTHGVVARKDLVVHVLRVLKERNDRLAAVIFVEKSVGWLTRRGFAATALQLVEAVMKDADEAPGIDQDDLVSFWNEAGNSFRYADRFEDALDAYERAERQCSGLPDEEIRLRTLQKNRAIVLRDAGRFREARTLLDGLAEKDPDDHGLFHTLAVFAMRTGRFDEADKWLRLALAVPDVPRENAATYLATLGEVQRLQRQDDQAVATVQLAWRAIGDLDRPNLSLSLAAIAVRAHPNAAPLQKFREDLRAIAAEATANVGTDPSDSEIAALYVLAEDALLKGDLTDARRALTLVIPEPRHPHDDRVGELTLAWGWLRHLEGGDDAWPWLQVAMTKFSANVPRGDEADYALGWVGAASQFIDRLLFLVPQVTQDAADLLDLYEVANGRELATSTDEHTASDWVTRIRGFATSPPVDVVALLDSDETLTAVVVPAAHEREPIVVPFATGAAELQTAVDQLARLDDANPVAPHRIDGRVKDWWRFAGRLARTIEPLLTRGAELVLLPGRRLASAPLHAAGWPERPLIASRPVSICPNLRVLLSPVTPVGSGRTGVVAVPKRNDSQSFRNALFATTKQIADLHETRALMGLEADTEAVLSLAEDVDELVFLCHGISSAGIGQGPGICLAAHGRLPESTLPVDYDAMLGDFALSWSDIIALDETPRVILSLACSTGRVQVGPGGTRLGIAQGFVSRGGGAIISPLWNVDQIASLRWLRAFYDQHRPGQTDDIAAAHQAACLETMREHPHPFAWAPFALSRRLERSQR